MLSWDMGLQLKNLQVKERNIGWMNLMCPCISWKVLKRRELPVSLVRWFLENLLRSLGMQRTHQRKGGSPIYSLKLKDLSIISVGTVTKMSSSGRNNHSITSECFIIFNGVSVSWYWRKVMVEQTWLRFPVPNFIVSPCFLNC